MSKVFGRFDKVGGTSGMGHATNEEAARAVLAAIKGELVTIPDPESKRLTNIEKDAAQLLRG